MAGLEGDGIRREDHHLDQGRVASGSRNLPHRQSVHSGLVVDQKSSLHGMNWDLRRGEKVREGSIHIRQLTRVDELVEGHSSKSMPDTRWGWRRKSDSHSGRWKSWQHIGLQSLTHPSRSRRRNATRVFRYMFSKIVGTSGRGASKGDWWLRFDSCKWEESQSWALFNDCWRCWTCSEVLRRGEKMRKWKQQQGKMILLLQNVNLVSFCGDSRFLKQMRKS